MTLSDTLRASIECNPALRVNGQSIDWQSIVTYTGGSSGSIAFVYERSRALLGAAVWRAGE